MATFALGPDNDLLMVSGRLARLTDRAAEIVQRLAARFRFFLATWFLDRRLGVPYFQAIFIKNPDLGVIRQLFQSLILTTPGVVEVVSLALDHITTTRELRFDFTARVDTGQLVEGGSGKPFIVVGVPT